MIGQNLDEARADSPGDAYAKLDLDAVFRCAQATVLHSETEAEDYLAAATLTLLARIAELESAAAAAPPAAAGNGDLRTRLAVAATVAYPGPNDTPASFMAGAAWKLEHNYQAGGSNVRAAVARVLRLVSDEIAEAGAAQSRFHRKPENGSEE